MTTDPEKNNHNDEIREIPLEYTHFFSDNSYEVLGLMPGVTKDEVNNVWRRLRVKFQPDTNLDNPWAHEISVKLNTARDNLMDRLDKGGEATKKEYREEEKSDAYKKSVKDNMLEAMIHGPGSFKRFVEKNDSKDRDLILDLLEYEDVKSYLVKRILDRLRIQNGDGKWYKKYIEEWENLGVKIDFFSSPEVIEYLEFVAVDIKIGIYSTKNPDKFLEFIEEWNKLGIDLSYVINTEKAKKELEFRAFLEIENPSRGLPNGFINFVDAWRRAGIDLSYVINTEKAKKSLESRAEIKLEVYGKVKFREFVDNWVRAGWDPSENLLNKLNN